MHFYYSIQPTAHQEQLGFQCLAQGYIKAHPGQSGNRASDLTEPLL